MRVVGRLLRALSYMFHFAMCLFFLGVAIVTRGSSNFRWDALPWQGESLSNWLLALSLIGLIATVLAASGKFPFLFPLWCLYTFWLALSGLFLNTKYTFGGEDGFKMSIAFTAALLVAAIVSLPLLRGRRRVR